MKKTVNTLDKLQRGCGWLLVNLFILGFLCWGLYSSFIGYRVETNGEITQGSVSDLELRDGGGYMAIVTFEVAGQTYYADCPQARRNHALI